MDRKTILAVTLCLIIFIGWQKFYLEPLQTNAPVTTTTQTQVQQTPLQQQASVPPVSAPTSTANTAPVIKPAQPSLPLEYKTLKTKTGEVTLSSGSAFLSNWTLADYHQDVATTSPAIDLASVTNEVGQLSFAVDDASFAYLSLAQGKLQESAGGVRWEYEDANLRLTRVVQADPANPYLDLRVEAQFKAKAPKFAFLTFTSHGLKDDPEAQDRKIIYMANNSVERIAVSETLSLKDVPVPVKFAGAASRYFLFALSPSDNNLPLGLIQPPSSSALGGKMSLVYPIKDQTVVIPIKVYFGAQKLDLLRAVDPTLDNAVDLGWFTVIAYPLLKLLNWFYRYVLNYGIAIILLTILLKIVTYPLTYKSVKNMKEMSKLQPQMAALREKYKDDKEKLNQELMTLMRTNGANPVAGCLPILIQLPIFVALYRVLYGSIELYHAPFWLWIHDLSAKDPYYVTPVVLTLTMYIQQKLTPNTATDPMQAKMMQFMPVMFGFMMLALPSGLTLYMLTNAIVSILQQMALNKKFGITPSVPAPVAKT